MAKIPGVHVPAKVKNYIINGNFDYWQRVENATITYNAVSGGQYTADRVTSGFGGVTTKNWSIVQSSNVPTLAQSGFESNYSYLATFITAIPTLNSGDYVIPFQYKIEGFDYQRIHSKVVTFGFWFQASVAGTYSFFLQNGGATRSYVTTFSATAASTWQYITITVTLDNQGTWLFNNGIGLDISIATLTGSTYQTSTLGSWQTGNYVSASTGTNYFATAGATFSVAQFSMVEGETSIGATGFQRAGDTISEELRMCQRYYEKSLEQGTIPGTAVRASAKFFNSCSATGQEQMSVQFSVVKRTAPTATMYSTDTTNASGKRRNITTATDESSGFTNIGMTSACNVTNLTANSAYGCHWTMDADL